MTIVPIQLNDVELQKIDYLIQLGKYKNRSQAIRMFISHQLEEETIKFEWENKEENQKRIAIVEKYSKKKEPILLRNKSLNSAEYIRNQRDERG